MMAQTPAPPLQPGQAPTARRQESITASQAAASPHGQRVRVDPLLVTVDDGDTVVIHWPGTDVRRFAYSESTLPRPGTSPTIFRSTSLLVPRHGLSPRVRSRPQRKSNS